MFLKSSLNYINEFCFIFKDQLRRIYLNSSIYNKKISKIDGNDLVYQPSLNILSSLIKYEKQKEKIEDFNVKSIWENKHLNYSDFKKLHSFYWLFSIDLKSSNNDTQSIIENWINKNHNYEAKSWELDILSKRLIAWISNSKITYDESENNYKNKFNGIVSKQVNHLINEIDRSYSLNNKMIGCTAITLSGIAYKNKRFLTYGLDLLKKIINTSFDNNYFPKSRNIRQMVFYLKYFILIRELLKDSLNEIPEYLDEIIFYLGKSYDFFWGSLNQSLLFNGNNHSDYRDFDKYLSLFRYKFKNDKFNISGYTILKNKNTVLAMDTGANPIKNYSESYQSGPLSFEFFYKNKKLITNSGYFQNHNHQLNSISKSSAIQSTLILDNSSACSFKKKSNGPSIVSKGFKTFDNQVIYEKKYWSIRCSHDGYLSRYGVIHQRNLEYDTEKNVLLGIDRIIKKKNFKVTNFEIRFHLLPNIKVIKLQDNKSILIELENSGWRFVSNDGLIGVETGLYFGNKNNYIENQNIFISGITQNNEQLIKWQISRI
ncbi:MAG: heparinase [Candidatus Pelagibacter sp.]|nr:heparinase [Candidatus Pelagibacter sp.]|tara:strand:- start:767 stop:2395 length:1629 start_codon:yes stop_codon:yes gene_type:complete